MLDFVIQNTNIVKILNNIGVYPESFLIRTFNSAGFWTNSYIIANKFTNQHKPTDKKNNPPPPISPTMTTPHLPQTIILHNTPEILENYLGCSRFYCIFAGN